MRNERNTAEVEGQGAVKIDQECVWDFMWTPQGGIEYLHVIWSRLYAHLPLVERADSEQGERLCMEAVLKKPISWMQGQRPEPTEERDRTRTAVCLCELCNYPPAMRGPLLEAALREGNELMRLQHLFDDPSTVTIFRRALKNLSGREKAILRVIYLLETASIDRRTDLCGNVWGPVVKRASLKSLREDPFLAELMGLYDLSVEMLDRDGER